MFRSSRLLSRKKNMGLFFDVVGVWVVLACQCVCQCMCALQKNLEASLFGHMFVI